ncbi:MAG: phosphoserine phosphatase SerB [Rhodospirillales bacterium]|nr:phosphoserine phosphatase SerB [Rhodospirillales bacterium]
MNLSLAGMGHLGYRDSPMQNVITLVANRNRTALSEDHLTAARTAARRAGAVPSADTKTLARGWAAEFIADDATQLALIAALEDAPGLDGIDRAVQAPEGRRKQVLVSDMDSTMIQNETLDTLATALGFGDAVMAITARSMAGELDFVESLRARVALLKGYQATESMAVVMDQILHTNGAERAVKTMVANGALCALVSGGFTFTTEVVHAQLGFQEHAANTLEIGDDGCFTGNLTGKIVGRATKLEILDEMCIRQAVPRSGAAAVGDGANDLDMLTAAGLGIGFFPKPIVREQTRVRIEHTDMTALLFYQGYSEDEFAI